jgi:crotonobetainyl-CoA:carnitine CoA-transferase CaiB-like acyl-CoA transferase
MAPIGVDPGVGALAEDASEFAHKTGFPDKPPLLPNLDLDESVAALYAAGAALTALRVVEVCGGRGLEIDLSRLEQLLSILAADQLFVA